MMMEDKAVHIVVRLLEWLFDAHFVRRRLQDSLQPWYGTVRKKVGVRVLRTRMSRSKK